MKVGKHTQESHKRNYLTNVSLLHGRYYSIGKNIRKVFLENRIGGFRRFAPERENPGSIHHHNFSKILPISLFRWRSCSFVLFSFPRFHQQVISHLQIHRRSVWNESVALIKINRKIMAIRNS